MIRSQLMTSTIKSTIGISPITPLLSRLRLGTTASTLLLLLDHYIFAALARQSKNIVFSQLPEEEDTILLIPT